MSLVGEVLTSPGGLAFLGALISHRCWIGGKSWRIRQKRNKIEKLVILKLGGSAITHKDSYESLNLQALAESASHIRYVLGADPSLRLVVVHGAGSFGHFDARQYNIKHGGRGNAAWKLGFAKTRASVVSLSSEVVRSLVKEGVQACAVEMFPETEASRGGVGVTEARRGGLSSVRRLLDLGFVPVLHGDAVLTDDFPGAPSCTILSGDVIMHYLSQELRPHSAVFLTDVPGVFDKSPKESHGAKLLTSIRVNEYGSVESVPSTTVAKHDVTGGILAKIQAAGRIAALGVRCVVVEVATQHACVAIAGETPIVGTTVSLSPRY